MYKYFLRPLLFSLSAERAHHVALRSLNALLSIPGALAITRSLYKRQDPIELMGLRFPNRVGLAAGFDKNAQYYRQLGALGFGFVEIGTVTPKAQPGNPQPRLFRLPADQGLINRMGFNNDGLDAVVNRLKNRSNDLIVGGNIGKNKVTPNDKAVDDYLKGVDALHPYVDYFAVNVSSPNTPGLRELQEKEPLMRLLRAVRDRVIACENPRPILLKIAPDMGDGQLDDIVDIVVELKLDGVIATNTTISREGLKTPNVNDIGMGGLSGAPVRNKSTDVVRYLAKRAEKRFVIIASGGVFTPEDAIQKIEAGANLVQVYTGFIYEGPGMVKKIVEQMARL